MPFIRAYTESTMYKSSILKDRKGEQVLRHMLEVPDTEHNYDDDIREYLQPSSRWFLNQGIGRTGLERLRLIRKQWKCMRVIPALYLRIWSFWRVSCLFHLYPENDLENEYFKEGEDNDRSLVTMVSYQGKRFLFTSDIEKERIELLLASGVDLSCDWIKILHHGNFNRQTEALLQASGAGDGVICCSKKNPAEIETIEAIRRAGMTCWITADGDITFTYDGEVINGNQE